MSPSPSTNNKLTPAVQRLSFGFVVAIGLGLLATRLWFHFSSSPVPDEAYYWLWGQRPALGYYDHPPFQAWLQGLSAAAFGASNFALRLPTLLSSLVIIWVLRRLWILTSFTANGGALPLLIAVFCSPLFFVFTSIAFNDHAMIAGLTLAGLWSFEEALSLRKSNNPNRVRLAGIGLMLGLAMLSKFNAAFFALGLLVFLVLDAPSRRLFREPMLYGAGMIALLCLMPALWWNVQNGAQTFDYNLNQRLTAAADIWELLQRALVFILAFGFSAGPLIWLGLGRAKNQNEESHLLRTLVLTILAVTTLSCLVLSYQTYVLFYWNIPALALALPVLILSIRRIWIMVAHMISGLILSALLIFNYTVIPLSIWSGSVDNESAIMHGWDEVSAWVEDYRLELQPDFVATTDYRTGSILGFWLDQPDVAVIAERISQFTIWQEEDAAAGGSALLLASDWYPISPVHQEYFGTIEKLDTLQVRISDRPVTLYTLYLANELKP